MAISISSSSDLEKLESLIATNLQKFKLGDVLYSLHLLNKSFTELKPFHISGFALFATRFCRPSKFTKLRKNYDIRYLVDLSNAYYVADPLGFDQDLNINLRENLSFALLRLTCNQFSFESGRFTLFARSVLLFREIPRQLKGLPNIPNFDFEKEFQIINEVSVTDFITTGLGIFDTSQMVEKSNDYVFGEVLLNRLREAGVKIPTGLTFRKTLDQLAADKSKLMKLYEKRKNVDRRFRMYDFNPLITHPIIKPYQDGGFNTLGKDYLHVPIPNLLALRISTGIFYQMFNECGEAFSTYFGHVFEAYVGLILSKSIKSEQLISESEIRKFYPPKKDNNCPDWFLIEDTTLILFECKATRFSRAAQAIASEEAVNKSLTQVIGGLKQLASFISACQANIPELARFQSFTTIKPIFVSLEPLYLINSFLFRDHVNTLLAQKGITNLDWQILSVDELEAFQPHIAAGVKLSKILDDLKQKSFNHVLEDLISQTHKTFADCFLYPKQEELYQRLGIHNQV